MYNYHREDLTDDRKYAELCRLLDVVSYLQLTRRLPMSTTATGR